MEATEFLLKLAHYFPYYVALVLVPMIVRTILEDLILGIRAEYFETHLRLHVSYEEAFKTFVLVSLYFPLFEELVFRALPLNLFGLPGLVIGSAIWVLMHPAWQLQYLSELPLSKKLAFTATCTLYYSLNAIFYAIVWLNGDGLVALAYHMIHNTWIQAVILAREIELPQIPTPWKKNKYRYVKPIATEIPRPTRRGENSNTELTFVVKRGMRSLEEELEEPQETLIFVKKEG